MKGCVQFVLNALITLTASWAITGSWVVALKIAALEVGLAIAVVVFIGVGAVALKE